MRAAWTELRAHPTRLVSVGLAVVISVAFVVACLVFVDTETHALSRRLTAETSTSDVVVTNPGSRDRSAQVAAVPGVAAVASTESGYAAFTSTEGPGLIELQSQPDRPEFRWSRLASGRWPDGAGQVAVTTGTAGRYGLGIGSTLTVQQGGTTSRLLQVSGLVDEGRLLLDDAGDAGIVDPAYFRGQADQPSPTLLVRVTAGTAPDAVATRLQALYGPDAEVQTAAEAQARALGEATGVSNVFGYLVVVFGGIALLVGSIIVVNTFGIVLGQRRGEIGLLRAVGATTGQVRRRLLAEALLIGVVGSVAGLLAGVGIATAASAVTGALGAGLELPWLRLLLVTLGGTAVTLGAALVPVLRATRVPPLVALRPVAEPEVARRTGRLRLVLGGLAVALGAVVVAVALQRTADVVLLSVAGAFVGAVGVLVLAGSFVPPLLRLAGRLTRPWGPVARLGAANLARNPGRASTTCTALMLAVGLIVTLQVGAASVRSTTEAALDSQFPVDLTVTNPAGPLSPTVARAVAATPGIAATTGVRMVTADAATTARGHGDGQTLQVGAPGVAADRVVASGLDRLDDLTALAHHTTIEDLGLRPGDRLWLRYQGRSQAFVLVASDIPDAGTVVVSDAAMTALAPSAPTAALWAAAAPGSDAADVTAGVRKALVSQPGLTLAGSLPQSAELSGVLDTLLRIATGLLGVAALIALVGVGNTLGLSVLERTRESALLRALGLQRRQLRAMLAVEAVLLAVVGAAIGIIAGLVFGAVGSAALAREADLGTLHLAVSPGQTLIVVGLTVVAGALASVLPARRAARTSPTAALAAG